MKKKTMKKVSIFFAVILCVALLVPMVVMAVPPQYPSCVAGKVAGISTYGSTSVAKDKKVNVTGTTGQRSSSMYGCVCNVKARFAYETSIKDSSNSIFQPAYEVSCSVSGEKVFQGLNWRALGGSTYHEVQTSSGVWSDKSSAGSDCPPL